MRLNNSRSSTFWDVALFLALTAQLIVAQVPVNSTTLSSPRKSVSSVSIEERVYFVGGFRFNQKIATNIIDVYNAVNQTWMESLYLPSPRGFVAPVVMEPNIYFLAGISQSNPPYFYQSSNRSFTPIQSGPTVLEPLDIYLFNSTLTVIGKFSVDFYDLNSGNWSYNSNLTAITMSLIDSTIIAYEEYVLVIGGQDIKSAQISSSAWIFNRRTQHLVRYNNVTTPDSIFFSHAYEVSENVLTIGLKDRCVLYHFILDEWHEEMNAVFTVSSFTLHNTTHLFGDNYLTYNWISGELLTSKDTNIKIGFTINSTIVYIMDNAIVIDGQNVPASGLKVTGPVRFAQPVSDRIYAFTDDSKVYWFSMPDRVLYSSDDLTNIFSMIVSGVNLHTFYYSEVTSQMNWIPFVADNSIGLIVPRPLSTKITPQAFISGIFVDPVVGTVSSTDYTDLQPLNLFTGDIVTAYDGNTFVVMNKSPPTSLLQQYKKMDIYNYVKDTWTTIDMPDELFFSPTSKFYRETFMNAAAFNDSIMVWVSGVYGIYNIENANWTTYYNVSLVPQDPDGPNEIPIVRSPNLNYLHFQTPVIDGTAYVNHNNARFFFKFAPDMLTWQKTASIQESWHIEQPVAYHDMMYVSMRDSTNITYLYFYDTTLDTWQATLLPAPSTHVAITAAGDYVIAVCSDRKLHIFSVRLAYWNTQELDYEVIPSTIIHVGNVTLIAGGTSLDEIIFSDTVLIISDDVVFIEKTPATPSSDNGPLVTPASDTGLTLGELIAAIVVPVLVVLGGGLVLLLVLLKKRKKGKQTTTIGLEQQFGEWFTPYNDIEFKEQIGQGANGQVFKGKWKNTDVALKVSMTQANQSVISELSLMINMRPHPNVVQLFGFSVHPETNSVILILEYCNGGSLDNQLMNGNTPEFPTNQKIEWLQGIARGVVHLHANKIVHRDIAARNVLLHQGEPKLTDFGMSRVVDDQQQRGTTKSELGPIRWMAPESLALKQYSTKSDVWSFGILMYEVIAQQEPHLNADPIAVGRQIRDDGLTPQIPSTWPDNLSSRMKQCWYKSPEQRPTMEEVLQLLEQM